MSLKRSQKRLHSKLLKNGNKCCICFSGDRKLEKTQDLHRILRHFSDITIPDEIDLYYCWECKENLRKMNKFIMSVCESFTILLKISSKKNDLSNLKPKSKLCINLLPNINYKDLQMEEHVLDETSKNVKHEPSNILDESTNILAETEIYIHTNNDFAIDESDENLVEYKNSVHIENLRCSICAYIALNRKEYNLHFKRRHLEKPICDCCGTVFENKNELLAHLNSRNIKQCSEIEVKHGRKTSQCELCGKIMTRKYTYKQHLKMHSSIRATISCPKCNKKFLWRENMRRHLKTHADRDTGQLTCHTCDKSFSSRATYSRHFSYSKRHAKLLQIEIPKVNGYHTFKFVCDSCKKIFKTKKLLEDHIAWEHLNVIKYNCNSCNKVFRTEQCYRNHQKYIHESHEKHLCFKCGREFNKRAILVRHLESHENGRLKHKILSYSCKPCGAQFPSIHNLYSHLKKQHNAKPHKANETSRRDWNNLIIVNRG